MTKRKRGFRKKTRAVMRKHFREKGKIKLSRFFASFKDGEKVLFHAEPAVQSGMYHPRFHSKVGVVLKQKGSCYDVQIKDGGKTKVLSVHPVHLRST